MNVSKILWLKPKHLTTVGKRDSVVLFHDSSCPKCNTFSKNHFEAANAYVSQELADRDLRLFRIDVHKHKQDMMTFLNKYNIRKFPSIVLFRKSLADPIVLHDIHNRKKLISEVRKAYDPLSEKFGDKLMKRLRDANRVEYSESNSPEDLLSEVGIMVAQSHRDPRRGLSNLSGLHKRPSLVLFHRPTCPHCDNFMPTYDRLAEKVPEDVRVLTIDMDRHRDTVVSYLNTHNRSNPSSKIELTGVPTVYLLFPDNESGALGQAVPIKSSEMTEAGILSKIRKMLSSRKVDERVVERLTGRSELQSGRKSKRYFHTLEDAVRNNCVLMFYASWCGACKRTIPLLKRLAELLDEKQASENVEVFMVDHSKHQEICDQFINNYNEIAVMGNRPMTHSLLEVTEYPTVYIFRSENANGAVRVRHNPSHSDPEHHYLSLPLLGHFVQQQFPEVGPLNVKKKFVKGLVLSLGGGEESVSVRNTDSQFNSLVGGAAANMTLDNDKKAAEAMYQEVFRFDTPEDSAVLREIAEVVCKKVEDLKKFELKCDDFFTDSDGFQKVGSNVAIGFNESVSKGHVYTFCAIAILLKFCQQQNNINTKNNNEVIQALFDLAKKDGTQQTFYEAAFSSSLQGTNFTTAWKAVKESTNTTVFAYTEQATATKAAEHSLIFRTKVDNGNFEKLLKKLCNDDAAAEALLEIIQKKYDSVLGGISEQDERQRVKSQIMISAIVAMKLALGRYYRTDDEGTISFTTPSSPAPTNAKTGSDLLAKINNDLVADNTGSPVSSIAVGTNAATNKSNYEAWKTGGSANKGATLRGLGFFVRDFTMTMHEIFYNIRYKGMEAHIRLLTKMFASCNAPVST